MHITHCVPDLKFDLFSINVYHPSTKLHPLREIHIMYLTDMCTCNIQHRMVKSIWHFLLSKLPIILYNMYEILYTNTH
jgi:hypothetical protein